jgi:Na+-driven multidrug efflux pump
MTFLKKKYYPLLISGTLRLIVITLLVMSDTIIAGLLIGENAVAGINLVTPVYSLSFFFGGLVSIGVPILYNNAMGRYEKKEADELFGNGMTAALTIGIILFIVVMLTGDYWLRICHPTQSVLDEARPYLFWYSFVILLLPITTYFVEMVLADGDDAICTLASLLQIFGNIISSIILCYLMGIEGIAIGSLIGIILALLACLIHFTKKGNSLRPNIALSIETLVEITKYSAIDAGSYLFLAMYGAFLNWFIPWLFGSDMLILVSVILFVKEMQLIFDGIGEAITPIMSVYLGESSYEGIRRCWGIAQKTAIVEGIIVTAITIISAPLLVKVFGISEPVQLGYAVTGLRILPLCLTFTSLLYLSTSYYLVRSRILLGLGLSALRDVALAIPMALIGGLLFGIYGLMAGVALSPAIAYIVSLFYVSLHYGRDNCPLLLKELEDSQKYSFYEFSLTPEEIVKVQESVDEMLYGYGVPAKTITKVTTLVEDLYMLIREKNSGREIDAECTVIVNDEGIQILTKDNGDLLDLTNDDMLVTSFRAYFVSNMAENMNLNKNNLTTMGYNRNLFFLKY